MGFPASKKQSQSHRQKRRIKPILMIGGAIAGLLALFALVIFALPAVCPSCTGWIGLPLTGASTTAQSPNSRAVQVGISLGDRAPDFMLTDVDGSKVQLSDLRGKPTIVYFSASWCTPCIPETQELARLKGRYPNLNILWISVDPAGDSPQSLREHRRKYAREDFIYALDALTNDVARQYQVKALGTFYLLDQGQLIVFEGVRSVGTQAFGQALERVVKQ